jgi:hypothetical protein
MRVDHACANAQVSRVLALAVQGESLFAIWAYKFVVSEVSAKIGRHFWNDPAKFLDAEAWDRLTAVLRVERAAGRECVRRDHDACGGGSRRRGKTPGGPAR